MYVVFPGIPRVLDLPRDGTDSLGQRRSAEILVVSERAFDGAVLIRGRLAAAGARIRAEGCYLAALGACGAPSPLRVVKRC